jgi:hypothetical protein
VNLIVDSKGTPTTVLCVSPTGEELLCSTKEELEQAFLEMPNCQMWFGREKLDD